MHINEFSLDTLLSLLRRKAKRIAGIAFAAAVVGYLLGCCIPKEYRSEASIIPENSEENSLGSASTLASMAGVSLGQGLDAIGPDLYPDVVASNQFLVDMLYTPVETEDGGVKADLITYLRHHTRMPFWGKAHMAVGRVMKMLTGPKKKKRGGVGGDGRIDPQRMGEDDEALVEMLKNTIGCQMNEKSGVIYVSYQCQDPLVAKMVVDTVTLRLQQFITDYRTSKARVDLVHYQELERESKAEYDRTARVYANYTDAHQGNLLQAYESRRDALENEMQLALTAYQRNKQQVQLAEAKVQEKTPAFTVLQAAGVPSRHAAPHKMLMAIMWAFLAGMGTVAYYYLRLLFGKQV